MEGSVQTMICPECGKPFIHEVKELFKSDDEEVYKNLFDSTYFTYTCPYCGHEFIRYNTFIYINENKKFVLSLLSNENELFDFIKIVNEGEDLKEYKARACLAYFEILEKILIFENDLNDKIIEEYKYQIGERFNIDPKNLILIKDDEDFGFLDMENKHTLYNFIEKTYKKIYVSNIYKEEYKRDFDYLVNYKYIYNIKNNIRGKEPLHLDIYRDKMDVCMVRIDGYKKPLYYMRSFGCVGDLVKVPLKDDIRSGIIESVDYLSEVSLGFSFDALRPLDSITYEYDKKSLDKTKKEIKYALFNDYYLSYSDYDLTDSEYDSYKECDILESEFVCSRIGNGKLTKNTRFVFFYRNSVSHYYEEVEGEKIKAIGCNNGHYYVLGKIEKEGKRFIFLVNTFVDYPRLEYIDPRCKRSNEIMNQFVIDSLNEENGSIEFDDWKKHILPGYINGEYSKASKKSEVLLKEII